MSDFHLCLTGQCQIIQSPQAASMSCCYVASVVSDSVRPHRGQSTRLLRPWDSPGNNTGVGCHFLLQCMKVKSESEVAQLCPTQRPHGLQPTRLLRPWDFPGKSTGVGCHCLLWWKWIHVYKCTYAYTHIYIHPNCIPISKSSICITKSNFAFAAILRNLSIWLKFLFHALFEKTHENF